MQKSVSKRLSQILALSLLISFCWSATARAEELTPEETALIEAEMMAAEAAATEGVVDEAAIVVVEMPEEGAVLLGDFRLTYYCCEKRKHICGSGSGITASGRPVEAGRSIAVDPEIIPLGSRVWIDFGDGAGWREYSADDTGSLVKGDHLDIAVETHYEALHQPIKMGRVCFSPPPSEASPTL